MVPGTGTTIGVVPEEEAVEAELVAGTVVDSVVVVALSGEAVVDGTAVVSVVVVTLE